MPEAPSGCGLRAAGGPPRRARSRVMRQRGQPRPGGAPAAAGGGEVFRCEREKKKKKLSSLEKKKERKKFAPALLLLSEGGAKSKKKEVPARSGRERVLAIPMNKQALLRRKGQSPPPPTSLRSQASPFPRARGTKGFLPRSPPSLRRPLPPPHDKPLTEKVQLFPARLLLLLLPMCNSCLLPLLLLPSLRPGVRQPGKLGRSRFWEALLCAAWC